MYKEKNVKNSYIEQDILLNPYIGKIYAKDVYDFCNIPVYNWEDEGAKELPPNKLITKLRKCAQHRITFNLPAAFFTSGWLVYRGMLKRAIIMDVIWLIMFSFNPSTIVGGIGGIIYIILYGFCSIPWYYKHIYKAIKDRGLLMRSPVVSVELESSLWKEGEPSLKRAVIYVLLRALVKICCGDILFSIGAIL